MLRNVLSWMAYGWSSVGVLGIYRPQTTKLSTLGSGRASVWHEYHEVSRAKSPLDHRVGYVMRGTT